MFKTMSGERGDVHVDVVNDWKVGYHLFVKDTPQVTFLIWMRQEYFISQGRKQHYILVVVNVLVENMPKTALL